MRSATFAHLVARRTWIWAALLLALSIGLAFAPLFDSLGFEWAFAMSVPASLAAADLGATFVRRQRPTHQLTVWSSCACAAAVAVCLLVPPLLAISLNAVRVRQCDWSFGLLCFASLPVVSALLGSAAGVVAQLWLPRRPILSAALAWLVVLGSIVVGVVRFYRAPAIFGYDPFAGYFPGTLYDEELRLGAAFWWSRLYQVSFALAALAIAAFFRDPPRQRRNLAIAGVSAAATLTLYLMSGRLGFIVSAGDVADALGGRRETEHFVIHYPRGPRLDPLIDAIAAEHEFRFAQATKRLGATPKQKIDSFYFLSADQKARWMGARNTYIAKPWRHEIYIQHEDFPHPTLRHEIAHVVAGEFGDPLFHISVSWLGWPPVRFNVGMIEGIAVAADWPAGSGGRLTPHQSVRAMQELDLLPPVRALLAPGFFGFSPAQSYTTAGSFVYFLLQRYGTAKVQRLYRVGGAPREFPGIFGKSLAELETEWHAEIAQAPLAPEDLEIARERYRKRAIFGRPCPHAVAERLEQAEGELAAGKPKRAVLTLERVCKDDPGEPNYRLLLGAMLGRAGEQQLALATYQALYQDDGTRYSAPLRARALWRAAELLVRVGDREPAAVLVTRALGLAIDEDTRRHLTILRKALVAPPGDPGMRALRDFLVPPETPDPLPVTDAPVPPPEKDPVLARAAQLPPLLGALGHYLYGRQLIARGQWAEAEGELSEAAAGGLDEPLVRRENDRLLTKAAFLAGDRVGARAAATRLGDAAQPLPVRLEAEDWLERIDFAEQGKLP
jgi:tetratricopeptide (TPR) repeat protein